MADALGTDADTLERMLLVLTAFGVLRRRSEGRYEMPGEMRPYLDRNDDQYVGGFVDHLVSETSTQINRLAAYLEHGKTAVDEQLPAPFEFLYRDEQAPAEFMAAMWSLSFAPSKELAELARLNEVKSLIDVGGASGPFAVAALLRSPTPSATVFDLPLVERFVAESRHTYDLADRLDFVPGDFFADELPGGDCIALGYVLSDWTDRTCANLLAKAYRACHGHGRTHSRQQPHRLRWGFRPNGSAPA
ncbi:hydroxyneurosporene methyltransferase [Actinomadura sp. KC06]|uniref:methyltransferase n=1 Tax=Actinomadura sp. KC06 TaxID=2530369 RepID=UPI00104DDEFB|nr:methyltransferase [Actinomadura sp. KC06]TDD28769.1 hydroxyneurosporene methyltransferase [Actinomadura sp. KC06]